MGDSCIKPTVLTPRTELKRKHCEIIDLTDEVTNPSGVSTETTVNEERSCDRRIEDDRDFGGDDDSTYEDALDEIELNPYVPGTSLCPSRHGYILKTLT